MQVLPIDVGQVIAEVMGISVVLVPVLGLTARYAFKPLVDSLVALRAPPSADSSRVVGLERRIAQLERQLGQVSPVTAPALGEPIMPAPWLRE